MSARIQWERTGNWLEAKLGEGALTLMVFYEHEWRLAINDRVRKTGYGDDLARAKSAAIGWAREKLKMMEAELKELEREAKE